MPRLSENAIILSHPKKKQLMEIVNIEVGTFKEMMSAWNSLKDKLEELQDTCQAKEPEEWLGCREVCGILGISSRTLQHLRSSGTLSFTRIDKKTLYRKQDVVSLLKIAQKKK